MKEPVLILLCVLTLINTAYSQQELSFVSTPVPLRFETYSLPDSKVNNTHYRKICAVTKTGLISMGTGAVSFLVGVAMINSYEKKNVNSHNGNDQGAGPGIYPALFGIFAFATGIPFVIGGGIHDAVNHHKHSLTLIAPNRNEAGLACNF